MITIFTCKSRSSGAWQTWRQTDRHLSFIDWHEHLGLQSFGVESQMHFTLYSRSVCYVFELWKCIVWKTIQRNNCKNLCPKKCSLLFCNIFSFAAFLIKIISFQSDFVFVGKTFRRKWFISCWSWPKIWYFRVGMCLSCLYRWYKSRTLS